MIGRRFAEVRIAAHISHCGASLLEGGFSERIQKSADGQGQKCSRVRVLGYRESKIEDA